MIELIFQRLRKSKRRTLSKEIMGITIFTSAFTLLILGTTMILVCLYFFYKNTQEDMKYILRNTNQQFQDKMQFVEDGAVTIRHNLMLRDFFTKNQYDENEAETQLAYSVELFSERNMVAQEPFIVSVYLYNPRDQYVKKHYYPTTVSAMKDKEASYQEMQNAFKKSKNQYDIVVTDNEINLCYRVYGDKMEDMGICIVGMNKDAISLLFKEIETYQSSCWMLMSKEDNIVQSYGDADTLGLLRMQRSNFLGRKQLGDSQVLCGIETSGFGIRTAVSVDLNNVFTIVKPTMFTFIAVLVLTLALAIPLSYGMSYRFTKELKKVAESLRAFGEKNFDVRMDDFPIDEFQDIGMVFNEMADSIKYLITQVYEKQILATQSQIKYLQSQINPHFNYNILAMLSIKAKMAENEELYQCLLAYSKLVQGKIFREKEIKIPVSEEIELVNFYLYLQNSRFQDKISYEIKYGNEEVKNFLIPRLLIEPLVENAVSHGLEPKDGNGTIWVEIYEKEQKLHIKVEDDGVGFADNGSMTDAMDINVNGVIPHTHTGLMNTRKLLHILYDDNFTIDIIGRRGEGTRVEITLPIERNGAYVESSCS